MFARRRSDASDNSDAADDHGIDIDVASFEAFVSGGISTADAGAAASSAAAEGDGHVTGATGSDRGDTSSGDSNSDEDSDDDAGEDAAAAPVQASASTAPDTAGAAAASSGVRREGARGGGGAGMGVLWSKLGHEAKRVKKRLVSAKDSLVRQQTQHKSRLVTVRERIFTFTPGSQRCAVASAVVTCISVASTCILRALDVMHRRCLRRCCPRRRLHAGVFDELRRRRAEQLQERGASALSSAPR
jgi:hypothetical protein